MMDLSHLPMDISGKKISVLGARRSGTAVAELLAHAGAEVLLSDINPMNFTAPQLQTFQSLNIKTEFGKHSPQVLQADLVIISPGIPANVPVVRQMEEAGIPIISEIEAAYWLMPDAGIIAVTGSNGKTTTTTLLLEMFKNSQYDVYCGGNIGTPFSALIPQSHADSGKSKLFILEVSSFQLERIVHFQPDIAVILNVSDDHMDRYDHNINRYLQAKLNICKNQTESDLYIYFSDDKLLKTNLPKRPEKRPFGLNYLPEMHFTVNREAVFTADQRKLIARNEIQLPGTHNLLNILAALNAAEHYALPEEQVIGTLRRFRGIEHRLEYVRTVAGVDYYNDSKATNVDAVKYALTSFAKPVIVILGGRDKDSDFSLLLPELKQHAKHAILIGEAAAKIEKVIRDTIACSRAVSMQEAVESAAQLAGAGEIVLLAPACASFDMFENYEHRGRVFKELVTALIEKGT